MAFNIDFYSFSKNTNSTKRPGKPDATFACTLLGETSIINPRIILVVDGNPTSYNYAYIKEFNGRYYFVQDWTWLEGRWSASLSVDALATWQGSIGATNQYVVRAAADYNGRVLDTLYPLNTEISHAETDGGKAWPANAITQGYYIIGIINTDSSALGSVSYYVFSNSQFRLFCKRLMENTAWLDIPLEDIGPEFLKALFNPFQYVVSCLWVPFEPAHGESLTDLQFGWWSLHDLSFSRLTKMTYSSHTDPMLIPKHPLTENRGDYMNLSPYSSYILDFMPFGQIELDTSVIVGYNFIDCYYNVDCVTGEGFLEITALGERDGQGDGGVHPLGYAPAQIGVPVQLSQITRDYLSTAVNAITATSNSVGSFMKFDIAGGIATAANGIASTIEASIPQMTTKGANGNFTNLLYHIKLNATFKYPVEEDNEHRGRPLCEKRTISSLPGYIKVADADIDIAASGKEIDMIKSAMNGGFYYE